MSERKRGAGTRKDEVVTREYTINLHKRLHGWYCPQSSLLFPNFGRVDPVDPRVGEHRVVL